MSCIGTSATILFPFTLTCGSAATYSASRTVTASTSDLPVVPPGEEEICSPRCIHCAGHRRSHIRRGIHDYLLDFSLRFALGLLSFQAEQCVDPSGLCAGHLEGARKEEVDNRQLTVEIAITLTDPEKGEGKAHACAMPWLHQRCYKMLRIATQSDFCSLNREGGFT